MERSTENSPAHQALCNLITKAALSGGWSVETFDVTKDYTYGKFIRTRTDHPYQQEYMKWVLKGKDVAFLRTASDGYYYDEPTSFDLTNPNSLELIVHHLRLP